MNLTSNDFLRLLRDDLLEKLKNFKLKGKKDTKPQFNGYIQAIPLLVAHSPKVGSIATETVEYEDLFPYFVVRLVGISTKGDLKLYEVMIAIAVYDEDTEQKGYETLINVIDHIMLGYRENNILAIYTCDDEMDVKLQEDDTHPQFYGIITLNWWTRNEERIIDEW